MLQPPFIIKVCGITNRADAQAAIDAGANALGFNFYEKSPRFISFQQAAEIVESLTGDFLRVGVFVHSTEEAPFLDVAQIHGSGQSSLPTWRAVTAGTVPENSDGVDAWLLDSSTPVFGGSGQTFDWSLAAAFPYRSIVAGGLDADNVADAIRIAHPWGVDACSRLESAPGRKDHRRVQDFVQQAMQSFHAREAVTL